MLKLLGVTREMLANLSNLLFFFCFLLVFFFIFFFGTVTAVFQLKGFYVANNLMSKVHSCLVFPRLNEPIL
jgi:uncharacterized membrane protein YobD (UPF0266 family)